MPQTAPDLAQYSIDGATFMDGPGGLPVLDVKTEQCEAQVFVHGAQVCRWAPAGHRPVLFLSPKAQFQAGKGIRGGVPISFPWFANRTSDPKPDGKPSPNHGFVRTRAWEVDDVNLEENGRVRVVMTTRDDEGTRALWDHAFEATMIASIGSTLSVSLEIRNTGTEEFTYEEALHTYFEVGDANAVRVVGFEPGRFIDKVDDRKEKRTTGEPVMFNGEVDSVFHDSKVAVTIDDPAHARHIRVDKTGSRTTVVWNPGMVLAQTIPDIGGDAWRSFICVEAANALPHAITLPPGAVHTISQRMSVISQSRI